MKTKKILSIALAILMLLGTFAVGASAAETEIKSTDIIIAGNIISGLEESYWLTVDGALTSDGASASNYNIAITPGTDTSAAKVVFNNAQISENSLIGGDTYVGIYRVYDLDIELKGTNKIDILPESEAIIYGVTSERSLRIYGNGSLELNTGNKWTTGIRGLLGDTVEISDDVKLKFNLKAIHRFMAVVYGEGIVVSDNAELEINEFFLENADAEYSVGEDYEIGTVYADGFYSETGAAEFTDNSKVTLNMINTDYVPNTNQGFDIDNSLEVSGKSQLTVNGTDGLAGCGIELKNGALTVKDDASINVKAGNGSYSDAYGIYMHTSSNKEDKSVTVSDNAKVVVSAGNAKYESIGMECRKELIATDNAYISVTSGNSTHGDSAAVVVSDIISLSGKAKLVAKSGDCSDENYGVFSEKITVSDDAQLESYSGISIDDSSRGIFCKDLIANGNAKITGESKGSTEEESIGVYAALYFEAYDNTVVNAKGGEGRLSSGLCSDEIKVYGSAKIDAVGTDSEGISAGIYTGDGIFTIYDNATINAKGGKGAASCGIGTSDYNEITVSGNAVVVAEASEGTEYSVGFATGHLNVKDNANIKATASASDKYSYGIIGFDISINDCATVEAAGDNSAFFSESYEIVDYKDLYIAVSTDKNPENAVEYDNSNPISAYEDANDVVHDSIYKYLLITSGAPEEPEPELNFFEQLIVDIVEFFDSIKAFFESLFSFLG